ncbi:disulfide oxidoreductase [Pontibacillus litoralis]|uniref:Probable disulfide formation protein n=1 Tax=Pontibacillus litoralis JSM 072002 TaxID=1385512 RepID=A0A0A5FVB3_9BACI|nr:disulfide oxidoreductase [Pontibacillus litoralis]KGX84736.1 dihydroneopterin aldolase [Pontibacillus litoralis JSM 072002]
MKKVESVLFLLWLQAFVATMGSLYFSEIRGFVPCEMCWYQRIFMYPLVLLYGLALIKKDIRYAQGGLYLSIIGAATALYHYGIQKVPALQPEIGSCGLVPCNGQYINVFGFITIPLLSLIAFSVIICLHVWVLKQIKKS